MESLVQVFDTFWRFWLGDYLVGNESLIQLLSVVCVIGLVYRLMIYPFIRPSRGRSGGR